jgi:hypothetical protein
MPFLNRQTAFAICYDLTTEYDKYLMFDVNSVWPNWNWKEVAALIEKIAPELHDLFVDRIIVPARPEFPNGYLKGEWIIRFTGRKAERSLLVSTRARHPYIGLYADKGPPAAAEATKSPSTRPFRSISKA